MADACNSGPVKNAFLRVGGRFSRPPLVLRRHHRWEENLQPRFSPLHRLRGSKASLDSYDFPSRIYSSYTINESIVDLNIDTLIPRRRSSGRGRRWRGRRWRRSVSHALLVHHLGEHKAPILGASDGPAVFIEI